MWRILWRIIWRIQDSAQLQKTPVKRKVKTTQKEANKSNTVDDEDLVAVKKQKRFYPNARCGFCDKKMSYANLRKHMLADHPEVNLVTVKCAACGKHVVEVLVPQHMAAFHGN
jgi:DNA-directed RNA polymerase subunit M/transcription elongation factor TFIIS